MIQDLFLAMQSHRSRRCHYRFFALLLALLATAQPAAAQTVESTWRATAVDATLWFYPQLLADLGLALTDADGRTLEQLYFTAGAADQLLLLAPDGVYQAASAGALRYRAEPAAVLRWPGGELAISELTVRPGERSTHFVLHGPQGPLFSLSHVHHRFGPDSRLTFDQADLRLSPALAERLGRPLAAGVALGWAELNAAVGVDFSAVRRAGLTTVPTCLGRLPNYLVNYNDDPADDLAVDVALTSIDSVECTFSCAAGNVAVNVAPSVELQNVGPADVPWFWRLTGPLIDNDPIRSPRSDFEDYGGFITDGGYIPDYPFQHPYLVWSLYRIDADGIHTLGRSAVKHAFNAINSDCPCPDSRVLWAENCADVYGTHTNTHIQHLGPRDEIRANDAFWHHSPSNADPDGDLMYNLDQPPPGEPLHEQLAAASAELRRPGRFILTAWYIVKDDRDLFNSLGYREILPTEDNGAWLFPIPEGEATHTGPLLDAWVDPDDPGDGAANSVICGNAQSNPRCAAGVDTGALGHLQLAVRTEALGGGRYRYRYALLNLDYDPMVRELRLPLRAGLNVEALSVRDADTDPGNDWQATVEGQTLRLRAPTAAAALPWDALLSFSFEADEAPVAVDAALFSEDNTTGLNIATLGPAGLFNDDFEASTAPKPE